MNKSLYPAIPKKLLQTITSADEIIIIGHKNPDGDCIFSQLALSEMLMKIGKKCHLVNQGDFNRSDIAPYSDRFSSSVSEEIIARNPLVIIVDCSTEDRPGLPFIPLAKLTRIVFDHHSSGEAFCEPELSYIVPDSVSTTLVLEQLRQALSIPLDKTMATYLFYGFATDSGFFHFLREANAYASLQIVEKYVEAGVIPYEVYDTLNDGKELSYYQAIGSFVNRTVSALNGKVLYSFQKKEEAAQDSVSDAIYSQLLTIKGVKVVFFFKEKEEGIVVVGMRSKHKSGIDVGAFAQSFGGGGHANAAGASITGTLDDTIKKIIDSISLLLNE